MKPGRTKGGKKTNPQSCKDQQQRGIWGLGWSNKTTGGDEGETNGKGEMKASLFAGDTVFILNDPGNPTRVFYSWYSAFCKVAGHKVSTPRSVASLYTNDKQIKKDQGSSTFHNSLKQYKLKQNNLPNPPQNKSNPNKQTKTQTQPSPPPPRSK